MQKCIYFILRSIFTNFDFFEIQVRRHLGKRNKKFYFILLSIFTNFAVNSGNAGGLARHRCGRGRPRSQAKQ